MSDLATTIAAVWGAVLSTVVLVLRMLDRRERKTRLKVKLNVTRTANKGVLVSTELRVELVNLSVPARAVHPTILVYRIRRPFVPPIFATKLNRVPLRKADAVPDWVEEAVPGWVAEGGSREFGVSTKPILRWLAKKPPKRRFRWQAIVYDETGERHRSLWRNISGEQYVPAGYAEKWGSS